ncbi:MAG: DUF1439 domain-containing protein [Myxococcota bacterium]
MRRLALIVLLLTSACAARVRVTMTGDQIERELSKSFPVTRSYSVLSVELSEPRVVLQPGGDRIGLRLKATAGVAMLRATGSVTVSGKLRYQQEDSRFFLDEPEVAGLELPGLPETQQPQLLDTINVVVRAVLPTVPIHKLEEGGAKLFLRAVRVEDGQVIAELGL